MFDSADFHHPHVDVVQEGGTGGSRITLVLHEWTSDCSGRVSETTKGTKEEDAS